MLRFKYVWLLLASCLLLTGCASGYGGSPVISPVITLASSPSPTVQPSPSVSAPATASPDITGASRGLTLTNTQYGFEFSLPESWRGYTMVESVWEGTAVSGDQAGKTALTGPQILIRHPLWTMEKPRQDIPIMIFTLNQWDALQKEAFHIGAAPVGPSELGRNSLYVFALPARYNYSYPEGFEEVDTILQGKPLKPFEPAY
jgi:hypothetical protein